MARRGPTLFTCPKCRSTYLGHEPLPDCPHCGHDYRVTAKFRWDTLVYLLAILALLSFLLVSSYYRMPLRGVPAGSTESDEKLPGAPGGSPIGSPYHERGG
jgi:hypothetical protein